MRTAAGCAVLCCAGIGCTPDGDDGNGGDDSGPPAGDGAFGLTTGTWDVTFDSGEFTRIEVTFGTGDDGRGLSVRTTRRADRTFGGVSDAGQPLGCRGTLDEVHLRLADDGDRMYGHAISRYPCGVLGEGERARDAVDWPAERFDVLNEVSAGSAIAWRTGGAPGPHGALDGAWHIEAPNLICNVSVDTEGELLGGCDRTSRWDRTRTLFDFAGLISAPMASGSVDGDADFAGQRIGGVAAAERMPLPVGDPLGGASGRWEVWGSRGASRLDVGAVLDIESEGTAVTARMRWNDLSVRGDFGEPAEVTAAQTLEVDLDVEGDAPGGTATWRIELLADGQAQVVDVRTYTAVRVEATPATLPLLGGDWLLVPPDVGQPEVEISLRGDLLTVRIPDRGGLLVFSGHADPRQITGMEETVPNPRRYGETWVSGRRVGDE